MNSLRGRKAWSVGLFAAAVGVLLAGYVLLIGPARSESDRLGDEASALSAQTTQLEELAATQGADQPELDYANLLRLAKALPDDQRDRDVIVELDAAAERSGAEFASITPAEVVAEGELSKHSYSTTFSGSYDQLVALMQELRQQATVRDGRLTTSGRLFTVGALDLHEGEEGFPLLEGSIELTAYAFGADPSLTGEIADDPAAEPAGDEPAGDEPAPSTEEGD